MICLIVFLASFLLCACISFLFFKSKVISDYKKELIKQLIARFNDELVLINKQTAPANKQELPIPSSLENLLRYGEAQQIALNQTAAMYFSVAIDCYKSGGKPTGMIEGLLHYKHLLTLSKDSNDMDNLEMIDRLISAIQFS